jgi:pimeloyl-ACP methyl ester carboxylesterase
MSGLPHDIVRVGLDPSVSLRRRFVDVDGIRTHYLECGEGPVVVLLHAGDFGGSGELSFEFNIAALATRYRVIAPDWLGFGDTDKLFDFGGGQNRRIRHMTRFLAVMAIDHAAFIGNSMGGTLLATTLAEQLGLWPVAAAVFASGGGFVPDNDARRQTMAYDATIESMRTIVAISMHDPRWADNEEFVARRWESSVRPGAWEVVAAARFKSPVLPPRSEFGHPDQIPYEQIAVPALIVAGAQDPLRLPGYAVELHQRVSDSRVLVIDGCGHYPQIEHAPAFNDAVMAFLEAAYPAG